MSSLFISINRSQTNSWMGGQCSFDTNIDPPNIKGWIVGGYRFVLRPNYLSFVVMHSPTRLTSIKPSSPVIQNLAMLALEFSLNVFTEFAEFSNKKI